MAREKFILYGTDSTYKTTLLRDKLSDVNIVPSWHHYFRSSFWPYPWVVLYCTYHWYLILLSHGLPPPPHPATPPRNLQIMITPPPKEGGHYHPPVLLVLDLTIGVIHILVSSSSTSLLIMYLPLKPAHANPFNRIRGGQKKSSEGREDQTIWKGDKIYKISTCQPQYNCTFIPFVYAGNSLIPSTIFIHIQGGGVQSKYPRKYNKPKNQEQ